MATATPTHGSKALLTIGGIALNDHLVGNYDFENDYATPDTTVFGATAMTNLVSPIQENKPVTLTLLVDATLFASIIAIAFTAGQAFTFGPVGSTTGNPKLTGSGAITNLKASPSTSDVTKMTITYTPSGAATWGVY